MVEMNEVSNILKNATKDSLLILDEIGRGTSTFDGLSIAWAVVEYISKSVGAKTLFATHYHELTSISENMKNVKNYCVAVKESGDDVVFLRKIIEGPADKSYGIYVASLAGVPESVITRAREIAKSLSSYDVAEKVLLDDEGILSANLKNLMPLEDKNMTQMSIYSMINNDEIIDTLKDLNVDSLTPVEALNILNDLKKKLI
jgi:DNA mismatch repair protein MutS